MRGHRARAGMEGLESESVYLSAHAQDPVPAMSAFDAWITSGATHRCGCGETYTDSDGGCDTVWECSRCDEYIDCEGEHPDERATRCEACEGVR